MTFTSRPLTVRFWEKVQKGDGCWEWQGSRQRRSGYGNFRATAIRTDRAHRVSWEMHNGPIPAGLHVLHHCDNPPCVRPSHLFLGTHGDNMRDAARKGRLLGRPNGPKSQRTKDLIRAARLGKPLSEAHREAIRRAWIGRKVRFPPNGHVYRQP